MRGLQENKVVLNKYFCRTHNISGDNYSHWVIEAENENDARTIFEENKVNVIKEHSRVIFEDDSIVLLTDTFQPVKEVKKNGFEIEADFEKFISSVEDKIIDAFAGQVLILSHFIYTSKLDMFDVILKNDNYGCFSISQSGQVHFNGHTCTMDERKKFESIEIE